MGRSYDTVQYPYIEVVCSNGTYLTKSKANYGSRLRGDTYRPDYFVSLEHNRIINGANTFTLNFNFVPGRVSGKDVNWFERQLLESTGHIKFRYGLLTSDSSEWSDFYFGFIESYTCTFSNGVLKYTVSGISSSVIANLDSIKNEDYYKIDEVKDTADTVLTKMEKIVNEDSSLKDYYIFDRKNSSNNFEITGDLQISNYAPMEYLNTIAHSYIKDKTDPKVYFYKIVVDDTDRNGKGRISLKRYSRQKISASYSFDWGSKDCDVISWNPQYDGSTALIFARDSSKVKKVGSYIEDDNGDTTGADVSDVDPQDKQKSDNHNIFSFDDSVSKNVTDLSSFLEASNYLYKGTITVLGLAGKKAENLTLVDSVVEVSPMINGELHHSAGLYQVLSITDRVSNGGFTTTLELQRAASVSGDGTQVLSSSTNK